MNIKIKQNEVDEEVTRFIQNARSLSEIARKITNILRKKNKTGETTVIVRMPLKKHKLVEEVIF